MRDASPGIPVGVAKVYYYGKRDIAYAYA